MSFFSRINPFGPGKTGAGDPKPRPLDGKTSAAGAGGPGGVSGSRRAVPAREIVPPATSAALRTTGAAAAAKEGKPLGERTSAAGVGAAGKSPSKPAQMPVELDQRLREGPRARPASASPSAGFAMQLEKGLRQAKAGTYSPGPAKVAELEAGWEDARAEAEQAAMDLTRLRSDATDVTREVLDHAFAQDPPAAGLGRHLSLVAKNWLLVASDPQRELRVWAQGVFRDPRFTGAEGAGRIPVVVKAMVDASARAIAELKPTLPASQVRQEALGLVGATMPQEWTAEMVEEMEPEARPRAVAHNELHRNFARALEVERGRS